MASHRAEVLTDLTNFPGGNFLDIFRLYTDLLLNKPKL